MACCNNLCLCCEEEIFFFLGPRLKARGHSGHAGLNTRAGKFVAKNMPIKNIEDAQMIDYIIKHIVR